MGISYPTINTTVPSSPAIIDLYNVPFGRELSFYIDTKFSQPRKYLQWFNGIGKEPYDRGTLANNIAAKKITIPLSYFDPTSSKFGTDIYSFFNRSDNPSDATPLPNTQLQCVNARGRAQWGNTGIPLAPYITGYRVSSNDPIKYILDKDLLNLDRIFLTKKESNFIYYLIGEGDFLWFFNDTDGKIKPMNWKSDSWGDQVLPDGTKPVKFSRDRVLKINAFWSAFSIVRRYITWVYFILQNIENTAAANEGQRTTIGEEIYILLDLEEIFNGWWNGPTELGFGQGSKPRFFTDSTEEKNYVENLASILPHVRNILNDPETAITTAINTIGIPQWVLEFWTDTEERSWVGGITPPEQIVPGGDGRTIPNPIKTPTPEQFKNLWIEYISSIPYKYTLAKLGLYAIPDVYSYDFYTDDGDLNQYSGGWYGEDVFPSNLNDKGKNKIWGDLSKQSIDYLNDKYIEKYKPLLDAADFLSPQVYIWEPINSDICDCTGGIIGEIKADLSVKKNSEGRNHHEQYAYDNVKRADLYNAKYAKGNPKPILPLLTSIYPMNNEFEQVYKKYCKRGWYDHAVHSNEDNNNFITDRFIDINTLKQRIKTCYDAVQNISSIKGFIWWNSGIPRLVDNSSEWDTFNVIDKTTGNLSHESIRKRRVYSLEVDPTTKGKISAVGQSSTDANPFKYLNYIQHKQKCVLKEIDLLTQLNNSIITTSVMNPENYIDIDQTDSKPAYALYLSNVRFGRETSLKFDTTRYTPDINTTEWLLPKTTLTYSGYWNGTVTTTNPPRNPKLIDLDRKYLNDTPKNFIYCMIDDKDQTYFYNNPTTGNLESLLELQSLTNTTDNINKIKNINSIWTGFAIAKRYINWCLEVAKTIENVNYTNTEQTAASIGNDVFVVLKYDQLFLHWWTGPSIFGKTEKIGSGGTRNRFFEIGPGISETTRQQQQNDYGLKLADIITSFKTWITNPENFQSIIEFDGIPSALKNSNKWYTNNPTASDTTIFNEWKTLIGTLPAKYRSPQVGIHGIPDVSETEADGSPNSLTVGWKGEKYGIDGTPQNTDEYWNKLNTKSIEINNYALIEQYKPLLDVCDILVPNIYLFEPYQLPNPPWYTDNWRIPYPLRCNKTEFNPYFVNSSGRDFWGQYVYDQITRCILYNTKYKQNKRILPILNTAYEYDDGTSMVTYCNQGAFTLSFPNTNQSDPLFPKRYPYANEYIWGRRIGPNDWYKQIRYVYDAVKNAPSQISGFIWWNNATPKAVPIDKNKNVYDWSVNRYGLETDGRDIRNGYKFGAWLRYRRYFVDDYASIFANPPTGKSIWDPLISVWDDANWTNAIIDTNKITVVTKELDYFKELHNRIMVFNTRNTQIEL